MENNAIVNTDQDKKSDFYDDVLAKRVRPKVDPEELEMSVQLKEKKAAEISSHADSSAARVYSVAEAIEKTTEYFKGDNLAANVWVNKYALKNAEGQLLELTPDDMHHRIAREIARIEKRYPNPMSEDEIFELIRDFRYIIPQGSPMAGIGNNYQIGSLSNCFVIGKEGSLVSNGAIMKTDEEQVQRMKRRGG